MDFARLLQSVEDAVYEIMVWITLLPKTFFRALIRPDITVQYVSDEWKKKPDERFDEYLSPVLLWLLVDVIPLTSYFILTEDVNIKSGDEFLKLLSSRIFQVTIYMMIIPFTYIVWMEWLNKQPVKKSTLKISFYRHCYALAPSQLLTALGAFGVWVGDLDPFILAIIAIIPPFYEAFVFQHEFESSYLKSFLLACVPQVFLVIIGFLLWW